MENQRFEIKEVNGRTDVELLKKSYQEKMATAKKELPEDSSFIQQLLVANLSDDELKWHCAVDAKEMQKDMSWGGFEMEDALVDECMQDEFNRLKREILEESRG